MNELIYYHFGYEIYHSHDRTPINYSTDELKKFMPDDVNNIHPNLTEGIYKSKKCINPDKAEINRFEEFIKLLNIKKGDSVLDAGCGHGQLVMYLRSKGILAEGITITETQYNNNIKRYGNYFHYGDYTKFQPQLVNKFDIIVLPGSLEHTFGRNPRFIKSYKYKYEKMKELFEMFKKYFKKNSKQKKILTTTLHTNLKFKNNFRTFMTERIWGSNAPAINKYSVAVSLNDIGYNILLNKDYSWHYYYASYCDVNHFGNPIDLGIIQTLLIASFYPHILYFYIYWKYGYWMWMFSNKSHKRRKTKICNPKKECDLYFEKDINKRPGTLFYTIGQLK